MLLKERQAVSVVGLGAHTPIGRDVFSTAAAARAAISAISEHPYFIDKAGEPMAVAMDMAIPTNATLTERMNIHVDAALRESLAPLADAENVDVPIPVFLGLPEDQPGVPQDLAQAITDTLHDLTDLPVSFGSITTFPNGHSAGLMALREAVGKIRHGEVPLCLVGGVDSWIDPDRLEWLDAEDQLMSAENRNGFPPGEGAGFCLLASEQMVGWLNLPVLGHVIAVETTVEPNRMKTETICIGEGLTEAFRKVIEHVDLPAERIDAMICDMNGERYRNEEFVFTFLRTQLAFVNAHNFKHPADCWGDVGAASGPLFTVLAIVAGLKDYADGRRYLLWTSSEGGQRAAALLQVGLQN